MSDGFWIGLFGFLASAISGFYSWRSKRAADQAAANSHADLVKTGEVHELVNGTHAELRQKVEALEAENVALKAEAIGLLATALAQDRSVALLAGQLKETRQGGS